MNGENQQIQTQDAGAEFGSFRNPEIAMKEAELVAAAFRLRAEKLQLYKQIGTSKHLLIEGWQMLASMYRITASITSTRYVEFGEVNGWEATAEAIHIPTGQVVSRADAICLSDEDNWGPRPKYDWKEVDGKRVKTQIGTVPTPTQQLRSMCQTRACSKVYSNLLKFVARMAGFAGTPAEEMTGNEHDHDDNKRGPVQQPGRKSDGPVISEAQAKRFYAVAKGAGRTDESINAFLDRHGFKHSKDITKAKYDQMCADVQKPDTPVKPNETDPIGPANGPKPTAAPSVPVADLWAEVVKAYGAEDRAIQALSRHGFESWSQVNQADRMAFAGKLIELARKG
jgi:hypothetical protein